MNRIFMIIGLLSCFFNLTAQSQPYTPYGIERELPTFLEKVKSDMTFPLAYGNSPVVEFDKWREEARAKLLECLLTPPPRPEYYDMKVIAKEQRNGYTALKIVFNISEYSRIPAYLLIPDKGNEPFPALVALNDHGAHFTIGKEKVIEPFGVSKEVYNDAKRWVNKAYGGVWIGDYFAANGYAVLAIDGLYWGERGRKEGTIRELAFEEQETFAANLFQLGMSWSGILTYDDIRSTEFLGSLPFVDEKRIGAVGLSVGSHRTWMLSAATDKIKAAAAICWMGTTETLILPGNNQTKGQSCWSMIPSNIRNYLDHPHVASIACPKPMLFYNGYKDLLFPVEGVKDAYQIMHEVWKSQNADDKLVTKLWDAPHEFNKEMQSEVLDFFNQFLKN